MWRPEAWPLWGGGRSQAVVRIGRHTAQWWRPDGAGDLRMLGQSALGLASLRDLTSLGEALAMLWATLPVSERAPGSSVQVVVESAWMPISLLDTGTGLWSAVQMRDLARHRFSNIFGQLAHDWELRFSYVLGDAHALATACPPELRRVLVQWCESAGLRMASMQPAFAWGCDRLLARRWARAPTANWWLWPEEDRTVLAWLVDGQLQALQPACESDESELDAAEIARLVAIERRRLGVMQLDAPVHGASWLPIRDVVPSAQWQVLGGEVSHLRLGATELHT